MFVLFLKEKVLRRKLYLWTSTLGDFIVICTVLSVNAENRSPQVPVVMTVCPVNDSLRFSLLFSDFIFKGIFVIWYWQFHYWQNSVKKLFVTSTLRKMKYNIPSCSYYGISRQYRHGQHETLRVGETAFGRGPCTLRNNSKHILVFFVIYNFISCWKKNSNVKKAHKSKIKSTKSLLLLVKDQAKAIITKETNTNKYR